MSRTRRAVVRGLLARRAAAAARAAAIAGRAAAGAVPMTTGMGRRRGVRVVRTAGGASRCAASAARSCRLIGRVGTRAWVATGIAGIAPGAPHPRARARARGLGERRTAGKHPRQQEGHHCRFRLLHWKPFPFAHSIDLCRRRDVDTLGLSIAVPPRIASADPLHDRAAFLDRSSAATEVIPCARRARLRSRGRSGDMAG